MGTQAWIYDLGYEPTDVNWQPWNFKDQTNGFVTKFDVCLTESDVAARFCHQPPCLLVVGDVKPPPPKNRYLLDLACLISLVQYMFGNLNIGNWGEGTSIDLIRPVQMYHIILDMRIIRYKEHQMKDKMVFLLSKIYHVCKWSMSCMSRPLS